MTRGRYVTNAAPILVQNASTSGAVRPCLSTAWWTDAGGLLDVPPTVELLQLAWSGTLGVPGSGFWSITGYGGSEDASVHVAVHGPLIAGGTLLSLGAPRYGGEGLRADAPDSDANALIAGTATLELALREAHADGVHDVRTIPKAWAHVQWQGSRYVIVDQECSPTFDGGAISSVELLSAGIAQVVFADGLVDASKYQVFVTPDYARLAGEASDVFIIDAPRDYQLAHAQTLFLYKRALDGSGVEYFNRESACDFHLWIYDNHGA